MLNFKMLPLNGKSILKKSLCVCTISIIYKHTTHFLQCLADKKQAIYKQPGAFEKFFHLQLKQKSSVRLQTQSSAVNRMQAL